MIPIGIDSETALILPGNIAPPLVCVSTARRLPNGQIEEGLFGREDGVALYHRVLADPTALLAIHNAPFDLAVACNEDMSLITKVFDAYAADRVCNTITLQKLIDVALGQRKFRRIQRGGYQVVVKTSYSLNDVVDLYYGEKVEKDDTWRLSFAVLRKYPIHRWPPSARHYAMTDASWHLRVLEGQQSLIGEKFGVLPDQGPQQRAAWALHLMGMWGIRADAAAVDRFLTHCNEEIGKMESALVGSGILKLAWKCRGKCNHTAVEAWAVCPACGKSGTCRKNPSEGSRTMLEIQKRVVLSLSRRGFAVPRTDPSPKFPQGQVKTDEETLRLTDDEKLHALADAMTFQKHKGQWGPVLIEATKRPVCCRYNELVDNGRTSCSGGEGQVSTNVQNPPRKGSVRPCIIASPGHVLSFSDADTIELRAFAQNAIEMVGWSKMAEVLRRQFHDGGPDLHVVLAAGVAGISEQEAFLLHLADDVAFANVRQMSKHGNFAFAGLAGAETFVYMARGFGIKLGATFEEELARAQYLRNMWFQTWPEARVYFRMISSMMGDNGRGTIRQQMSGRIRGDCSAPAAANSFFSGRVADAEKMTLFRLADECYTGRCTSGHTHGGSRLCTHAGRSILFGSRPTMFLHDETSLEHPEDGSESDRAERHRDVHVECLTVWMKDVPCTAGKVISRRWHKGAKELVVDGKTVPVKPEKVVVDGKERVKWVQDFGDNVVLAPDQYDLETQETGVEVAA